MWHFTQLSAIRRQKLHMAVALFIDRRRKARLVVERLASNSHLFSSATLTRHGKNGQLLAVFLISITLFACTGENESNLETYVQKIKAKKKGKVPPLPKPQVFGTYEYVSSNLRDPFRPITIKIARPGRKPNAPTPKCKPPRDVLENFPLDTLRMVGSLEQKGQRWALIKSADGTLYRTKKGKCMGQNNGKVTKVSDADIELQEIVPDGLGSWIERKTVLSVSQ